jgi:hypothetical protein
VSCGAKAARRKAARRKSSSAAPWHKATLCPGPGVVDNSRLLEEVASEANLARALLNVVRNKGAPRQATDQVWQRLAASKPLAGT